MSFGRRLRLFLFGIVVIPMVVLAFFVVQVTSDSQDGKADARLASAMETARALYDEALATAPDEAREIGREIGPVLTDADQSGLRGVVDAARRGSDVVAVQVLGPDGEELASSGPVDAIALGESAVGIRGGDPLGTVRVGMLDPASFLDRVEGLTGQRGEITDDDGTLAISAGLEDADLPDGSEAADADLDDEEARVASLTLEGAGPGARLVLATPVDSGFAASEPVAVIVLVLFFAVAFVFMVLLLRDLQRRIATMHQAATRIGEGDLETKVPVEGNDEMAGLAREMNRMGDRLQEQMQELRHQRKELDESVRRIGAAFASGLDREALLEIVADTAVAATGAEAGRVGLLDRGRQHVTKDAPAGFAPVLQTAGLQVWEGTGEGVAVEGDRHAIAEVMEGNRVGDDIRCAISVGRTGKPFTDEERATLRFLISRTIESAANIDQHERVAEQALTDELTRIPNHRHFTQWLENETARIDRYGGELSLVLLDIDDFKLVNDTRGHLQGDRVLTRIGALLAEQLRGVDLAARYGGEEFVLALPDTPRDGALQAAERLRRAVSQAEIEGINGTPPISITASLGVATLPTDAADGTSLIAAADDALYEAKRTGKNRVVAAAMDGAEAPQGKAT